MGLFKDYICILTRQAASTSCWLIQHMHEPVSMQCAVVSSFNTVHSIGEDYPVAICISKKFWTRTRQNVRWSALLPHDNRMVSLHYSYFLPLLVYVYRSIHTYIFLVFSSHCYKVSITPNNWNTLKQKNWTITYGTLEEWWPIRCVSPKWYVQWPTKCAW